MSSPMRSARSKWWFGAVAGVLLAALPGAACAAVGDAGEDAVLQQFRVLPKAGSPLGTRLSPIITGSVKRHVVVRTSASEIRIRNGLFRATLMIAAGFLGLAFVGYRAYGRRQASGAT